MPGTGPTRPGLVPPVRVDPAGLTGPTPDQARGPRWRRTSHGLYVRSSVAQDDVEQRIVEAAAVVPEGFGITGWAALRWLGGRWFGGLGPDGEQLPVTVAIGTHDIRAQPAFGIAVTGERLPESAVVVHDGLAVTTAAWSVSFAMRHAAGWREAVRVLDMAAFNDLVSIEEMRKLFATQNGWTGVPQARQALPWCQENSWSPLEVGMRLVWEVDAGVPRPLCNRPIFDLDGRHLGTPDLLDVESGLMGEYDGSHHLVLKQRGSDNRRGELLRSHDLESVVMMADDFSSLDAYLERLHRARRTALRRQPARRTWTIEPPAGWVPTLTVAQRRSLTAQQRARFLRHRRA